MAAPRRWWGLAGGKRDSRGGGSSKSDRSRSADDRGENIRPARGGLTSSARRGHIKANNKQVKSFLCHAWVGAQATSIALSAIGAADAAEYTYTYGYTAEYSDNIRLVPTNAEDELTQVLSAGFQLTHSGPELDAQARGRAAYRYYQHDAFTNEASFGLSGSLVWKPRPDAFHWTVEEVYTQIVVDPRLADTPANRLDANVLSTGPDIFWRVSAVHRLQLGGRFVWSTFDTRENTAVVPGSAATDSTRQNARIAWYYRYSPRTEFSVSHLAESAELDDPSASANFDFRRYDTTFGLTNRVVRNNFELTVGNTRIERPNRPDAEGTLGRLSWLREITSVSSFSLTASRSLSDTVRELLTTNQDTAVGTTTASVASRDIFVSRRIAAAYSRRATPNSMTLSAFRAERVFEQAATTNEESKGANVELGRTFGAAVTATVSTGYSETLFPSVPREDKTRSASIGLRYQFGRTVSTSLAYVRQSRASTNPGAEYVENRVVVSLDYNSPPLRW